MSDPSMREWIRSSRSYDQIVKKMGHVFADWHIGKIADHVSAKITDLEQELAEARKAYDEVEAKRIDEALSEVFDDLSCFETRTDAVRQIVRDVKRLRAKLDSEGLE